MVWASGHSCAILYPPLGFQGSCPDVLLPQFHTQLSRFLTSHSAAQVPRLLLGCPDLSLSLTTQIPPSRSPPRRHPFRVPVNYPLSKATWSEDGMGVVGVLGSWLCGSVW